ncbi:hypothetical protein [Georgenia sp. SUBG003]|uniref:hypothetical protein n=1 Tax=Georgenia sp. SUBG003 TaxID=1497974 RepID=UPI003AB512D6
MNAMNEAALPWLTLLIVVPLAAAAVLWLVRPLHKVARPYGLAVSLVVLVGAVAMATQFDLGAAGEVQLTELASWIPQLGVSYALGVNGLGLAWCFSRCSWCRWSSRPPGASRRPSPPARCSSGGRWASSPWCWPSRRSWWPSSPPGTCSSSTSCSRPCWSRCTSSSGTTAARAGAPPP